MKKILLIVSLLCNFEIIPMTQKSFASDNYAGIHPDILEAIIAANKGHEKAYGNDVYTQKAIELFKHYFGKKIDVYFVLTGTAANVLGLQMLLHSFQAILCAESAHINVAICNKQKIINIFFMVG
jgi:threonine aldolase